MSHHFILYSGAWGAHHTKLLAAYGLPSLMASGNVPFLVDAEGVTVDLIIYTRPQDVPFIEASPALPRLRSLISVELRSIEMPVQEGWPKVLAWAHHDLLARTPEESPFLCYLWPDSVWPQAYLRALVEVVRQGYDLAFEVGLRTSLNRAGPLLKSYFSGEGDALSISSTDVARIGMANLHSQFLDCTWDSSSFTSWPSVLLFPVAEEGAILHTFHANVSIFRANRKVLPAIREDETLDGGAMIGQLLASGARPYYLEDSEQCFHLELSLDTYVPQGKKPHGLSTVEIAAWAFDHAQPFHLDTIRHGFQLRATPAGPRWDEEADRSKRIVAEVLQWYDFLRNTPGSREQLRRYELCKLLAGGRSVHVELDRGEWALERALGLLLSGRPVDALKVICKPIVHALKATPEEGPDPVEWAWFLLTFVCTDQLDQAHRRIDYLPHLIHPELERARWVIRSLVTEDELPLPRSDAGAVWTVSRHPIEDIPFNDWLQKLILILQVNGRDRFARLLESYNREQSPAKHAVN